MNKYLLFLYIFITLQDLNGQTHWKKITSDPSYLCDDFVLDVNGNCYFSIVGYDEIYKINLQNPDSTPELLPRVVDFPFATFSHNIKLELDSGDRLLALFGFGGDYFPLKLVNDSFVLDNPSNSSNLFIVPEQIKFNKEGDYFVNTLNEIYKYNKKWSADDWTRVFVQEFQGGIIRSFFTFDSSKNYAVIDNGSSMLIYKYNYVTKASNKIVQTSNLVPDYSRILVLNNGSIFIPTISGLYRYSNDGNNLNLCLIDSVNGANQKIDDFQASIDGNQLVAMVNGLFYISTDNGDSWSVAGLFNANFPEGEIIKLKLLDSINAVAQVFSDCSQEKQLYFLSSFSAGWSQFNLKLNYWNYSNLHPRPDGRIFALKNLCSIQYTEDNGTTWKYLKNRNALLRNLQFNDLGEMITWYSKDSNLIISSDKGVTWTNQFEFEGNITLLQNVGNNSFLVESTKNLSNGTFEYFYYFSIDGGKSWQLKLSTFNKAPIGNSTTTDHSGNLVSFNISGKVFRSTDLAESWQLDQRFADFSVRSLQFFEGNHILINGDYKNESGSFMTTDFINVKMLDPQYQSNNTLFNSYYLGKGHFSAVAPLEGIRLSNDFGDNWVDLTNGLNLDISKRFSIFTGFAIDRENKALVSIEYDGIYQSNNPFVNVINPNNKFDKVFCSPNPTKDYISITLGDENQDAIQLQLINLLGQTVWTGSMQGDHTSIHVTSLPTGMYSLWFIKEGHLYHMEKIVKQ